eukprot:347001_1
MALRSSIVSLLFIYQLNAQTPDTGHGCFSDTCPEPGQVRRNAVLNIQGDWLGGCNCGCRWQVYDPSSLEFCASPNVVNFNPITLVGDCSCGPRAPTPPPAPLPTYQNSVPIPRPAPATPNVPTVPNFQNTERPILPTLPHILPRLPTLAHNTVPPPTPSGPPRDIEVICDLKGPCSCPVGHRGRCTIICEGKDPDACKDTIIECNNDGYPCVVNCFGLNACAGSSSVMGPAGSSLEVNCLGEKSCEGATQFNGEAGTDMRVACDGMTSCKGVQFNFGSAVSLIECNGEPDSCIGAVFNLLPHARTTPGAAYSCQGSFCPEVGTFAPEPFSNVVPGPASGCNDVGSCGCVPGANEPCDITCDGYPDACKDGIISCNSDGFACVVNCMSEQACAGSAEIIGPKGASLTVHCKGMKACEGSTVINAMDSTDVTVVCQGGEACKGNMEVNFGYGKAAVYCHGDPDSCEGAVFNLLPDAATIAGAGFSCTGARCPADAPPSFSNGGVPVPRTPIIVVPSPIPSGVVPSPIPPGVVPSPITPGVVPPFVPVVPIPPVTVPIPPVTVPIPPATVPAPQTPQTPQTPAVVPGVEYCCLTSIANFKPWAGRCWDQTTEITCLAEPNGRCVWDVTACLPNPPVNSLKPTPCAFYEDICLEHSDCCSETCNPNGFCR